NKVELEIDVTQEAYQQLVPRFLLQPLIENSIIHGLNQGSGKILIKANTYDDVFEIKISDNGQGMEESQLEVLNQSLRSSDSTIRSKKGFSSIGMTNVYERLQLSYRLKPDMVIESRRDFGTTILIK